MTINFTNLFTRLGKGLAIIEAINTSRGTTIPALMLAYQDEFDSLSLALKDAAVPAAGDANDSYKSGADSAVSTIRTSLENVLMQMVDDDANLSSVTITLALTELIEQMIAESESVDASAVAVTPSAITGNGNGVLVASAKRPDGLAAQHSYAETVTITCTSATAPATATFTATSPAAVQNKMSSDWPGGSGIGKSITATSAASSLLGNGDFDDEDDRANTPDEWVLSVGTIGTTIKMTDYEVQAIAITGGPDTGTWTISWQNGSSKTQTTAPLAYNATQAAVQAALRALEGLEEVTVESTGTTPNLTHSITFTGVAGNLNQVTVTNNTNGTITPSTTSAGSANAYKGKAVEFDSDGAELTTLNRLVSLEPMSQYAFNCFMLTDSAPAAGVLTVDLVDGIGGSVIADQAGTNNSFTIDATALTTSWVAKNGVFRTPKVLPPIVYLRIRISTAVSNTSSVFIDHAALVKMTSLYSGGPEVAIFSGSSDFTVGSGQTAADYFTLAVTNDRAGEFQEWFERCFDMAAKGLILPSDAGGSETIDDALIA